MSKSDTVKIDAKTFRPITENTIDAIPGTEVNHFYNCVQLESAVVGFRNLSDNYSAGSPEDGPEARVRLMTASKAVIRLAEALGLTKKTSPNWLGGTGDHWSVVTTKASTVIDALTFGISCL